MASLKDKRIVVLGGTSGLGFAAAQAAGAEGAQLVVASGRQARVDRALSLLPKGTTGYTCDFTHEGQIKDLFGQVGAEPASNPSAATAARMRNHVVSQR